jgi:hypothetical protein
MILASGATDNLAAIVNTRTAGIGATSPSARVTADDWNLTRSRRRVIGRPRLRAENSN